MKVLSCRHKSLIYSKTMLRAMGIPIIRVLTRSQRHRVELPFTRSPRKEQHPFPGRSFSPKFKMSRHKSSLEHSSVDGAGARMLELTMEKRERLRERKRIRDTILLEPIFQILSLQIKLLSQQLLLLLVDIWTLQHHFIGQGSVIFPPEWVNFLNWIRQT